MGDPISVAGTAVGVISLGIQVTQSLVNFYNSYKSKDSDLAHTADKLDSLLEIFQSLKKTLSDRKFLADEEGLVKNIETSIQNCDDLVYELQDEVQKFTRISPGEKVAIIKRARRRATYPFRQSTLQKLDEDIKDIRANISSALDALHLNDNKKIQDDTAETKDLLGLIRTSQISLELRDWLKAPDAFIDHHAACEKKQPGSGAWLVKSDQFSRWLIDGNSIMWLNGFAGSGKSVLCSTAISCALRRKRSDRGIGVAFFYFTFNDNSKQAESAMLRALLLQLSDQAQNNNADLTALHKSNTTGVPSSLVLIDLLKRVIQRFRHVYILLDALDESPRNVSRERVLDTLEKMRNWDLQCLHLLVTSRDERDIRESLDLSPVCQVRMQNSGIDKDIINFISGRLDTDRRLKNVLPYRERVQESLAARAKGMFRWVDCQLQTLRSYLSEHHLDVMLSSLPESLDETYERMLCNIDSYWIEDARRMLTMLCFASRPLTVQELIDSVAVQTGKFAGLNRKRRLQDSNGIREICGGLVDIFIDEDVSGEGGYFDSEDEDTNEDEDASEDRDSSEDEDAIEDRDVSEDWEASVEISHKDPRTPNLPHARTIQTVRIAHFSVQEYLASKRISGQKAARFGLSSITAHAEIAEVCLIYLLEPGLSRSKLDQAILEDHPLAQFAATYWYYHYRKTENFTEELDACILRLFQRQTSFATWIQLHDVDDTHDHQWLLDSGFENSSCRVDDIQAPIYYASLLGLDKVLHRLLYSEQVEGTKTSALPLTTTPKASKETSSTTGRNGGAIHAAAYHGYDHIIRILLDSGFDINDQGGYAKGSALHIASSGGHANVVQTLLDGGADYNAQSRCFGSALQAASLKGHKEIVQMLLDRGADINAQTGGFGSALQWASYGGHKEIVQRLLDRGAEVNTQNNRATALQNASRSGYKDIVQILLDGGADVNEQIEGYSALQVASLKGHKEIVQMLLDRGADINARSEGYGTALCLASEMGSSNIVQMLLDSGARVSIVHSRALKAAVRGGDSDVVQMLLNCMKVEDFDNEWQMASSSSSYMDVKMMELLQTHDFRFRHKPSVTEEA